MWVCFGEGLSEECLGFMVLKISDEDDEGSSIIYIPLLKFPHALGKRKADKTKYANRDSPGALTQALTRHWRATSKSRYLPRSSFLDDKITITNGRRSNDILEPLVRSNRIAHGQSPENCRLIWQGATRLLQEFQDAAMHGNAQTGINVNLLASIWQPPPYRFVKVICDAAWLPSSKQPIAKNHFYRFQARGTIFGSSLLHSNVVIGLL
nr:heat shock transcription factor B4 [Tanacetum cinerariifolium]